MSSTFNPFKPCSNNPRDVAQDCQRIDMNLICMMPQKQCACRPDMKWNSETGECQIYFDVDCSSVDTSDLATNSSGVVSAAADSTVVADNNDGTATNITDPEAEEAMQFLVGKELSQIKVNASLEDSSLPEMNVDKSSQAEVRSEFCREVFLIAKRYEVIY